MPPNETKNKQKLDIFGNITEMLENMATKDDLKSVIDTFATRLKETAQAVATSTGDTVTSVNLSVSAQEKKLNKAVYELDKRFSDIIDDEKEFTNSQLEALKKALDRRVSEVMRLMPEEADFTELYEEMEEMEKKHEEQRLLFTAENIRNSLELLEGDERLKVSAIDGLEEIIASLQARSGGSGGVAMPVAHWPRHESFPLTSATTYVTLQEAVGAAGTAVFAARYMGQVQDLDNQYSIDGNKVTLNFTPIDGTTFSISYMP